MLGPRSCLHFGLGHHTVRRPHIIEYDNRQLDPPHTVLQARISSNSARRTIAHRSPQPDQLKALVSYKPFRFHHLRSMHLSLTVRWVVIVLRHAVLSNW